MPRRRIIVYVLFVLLSLLVTTVVPCSDLSERRQAARTKRAFHGYRIENDPSNTFRRALTDDSDVFHRNSNPSSIYGDDYAQPKKRNFKISSFTKRETREIARHLFLKLKIAVIFRDNVLSIFSYLLGTNKLTEQQYESLQLIRDFLQKKKLYIFDLLPILGTLKTLDRNHQTNIILLSMMKNLPSYLKCAAKFLMAEIYQRRLDLNRLLLPTGSINEDNRDYLANIDSRMIHVATVRRLGEEKKSYDAASKITESILGPVFVSIFHQLKSKKLPLSQELFGYILINLPNPKLDPILEENLRYIFDLTRKHRITDWKETTKDLQAEEPYSLILSTIPRILANEKVPWNVKESLLYIYNRLKPVVETHGTHKPNIPEATKQNTNLPVLLEAIAPPEFNADVIHLKNQLLNHFNEPSGRRGLNEILTGFDKLAYKDPLDVLMAILTRVSKRQNNDSVTNDNISRAASVILSSLYLKKQTRKFIPTVSSDVDIPILLQSLKDPDLNPAIRSLEENLLNSLIEHPQTIDSLNDLIPRDKESCSTPKYCLINTIRQVEKLRGKVPAKLIDTIRQIRDILEENEPDGPSRNRLEPMKLYLYGVKREGPLILILGATKGPKIKDLVENPESYYPSTEKSDHRSREIVYMMVPSNGVLPRPPLTLKSGERRPNATSKKVPQENIEETNIELEHFEREKKPFNWQLQHKYVEKKLKRKPKRTQKIKEVQESEEFIEEYSTTKPIMETVTQYYTPQEVTGEAPQETSNESEFSSRKKPTYSKQPVVDHEPSLYTVSTEAGASTTVEDGSSNLDENVKEYDASTVASVMEQPRQTGGKQRVKQKQNPSETDDYSSSDVSEEDEEFFGNQPADATVGTVSKKRRKSKQKIRQSLRITEKEAPDISQKESSEESYESSDSVTNTADVIVDETTNVPYPYKSKKLRVSSTHRPKLKTTTSTERRGIENNHSIMLPPNIELHHPLIVQLSEGGVPVLTSSSEDKPVAGLTLPGITELLRSPKTGEPLTDVRSSLSKVLQPLSIIFGKNYVNEILRSSNLNRYPTNAALLRDLLKKARSNPKVTKNPKLLGLIGRYVAGLEYVSSTVLLPLIASTRNLDADVVYATFNPKKPRRVAIADKLPSSIATGNRVIPLVNPKNWLQSVDSANPYEALLPTLPKGDRFEMELRPLREILTKEKITEVLGEFDPLVYPNRGALLMAILHKLKKSEYTRANNKLKSIIDMYLKAIELSSMNTGLSESAIINTTTEPSGKWQPELMSLLHALPTANNEEETLMYNTVKTFLSQTDLLAKLGLPRPASATTRGELLQEIIRAALSGKVQLNAEMLRALRYYEDKIMFTGAGALPITWVWVRVYVVRTEVSLGAMLENTIDFEELSYNQKVAYNKLVTYLSENSGILQEDQNFTFDRYKTQGEFIRALFKYLLKRKEVDSEAKKNIVTLLPYVKLSGSGQAPVPATVQTSLE